MTKFQIGKTYRSPRFKILVLDRTDDTITYSYIGQFGELIEKHTVSVKLRPNFRPVNYETDTFYGEMFGAEIGRSLIVCSAKDEC